MFINSWLTRIAFVRRAAIARSAMQVSLLSLMVLVLLNANWAWASDGSELNELAIEVDESSPLSIKLSDVATDLPHSPLQLDTAFSRSMLDFQNRQTDKELFILENSKAWGCYPTVIFGGQARLSLLAATTNTEDKFSYLGRFPPDFDGNSATDARMLHANFGIAAHVNNWINVYGEILFSDVFSFPDFKQGSLQMRQAYAVFGDLSQSPWYAFIGKKNVSFGDMGTLSPFSQSVVWHYFGALHEGLGVGFTTERLDISLMGINGGRGIRAADSEARGHVNNFAVNAALHGGDDQIGWTFGGGYLLGTIYDVEEAEHLDPNAFGPYNSAWDVNAEVHMGRMNFAGELASTVDDWPVTDHPVIAYRAEAAIEGCFLSRPAKYSVSWSEGIQGSGGSEFEFNRQLVIGMGLEFGPYALLSLEYVRSMGFAPLIHITTVSDRDVVQDSFVMGMAVVF